MIGYHTWKHPRPAPPRPAYQPEATDPDFVRNHACRECGRGLYYCGQTGDGRRAAACRYGCGRLHLRPLNADIWFAVTA